jgi:hypothetical protein
MEVANRVFVFSLILEGVEVSFLITRGSIQENP